MLSLFPALLTNCGHTRCLIDVGTEGKATVRKARLTENRLLFIVTALKQLFRDENFVTLMRAEQMEMLPAYLAERIQAAEKG